MKSCEIVRRAVRFENPPRIPYNFDSNRTPDNGEYYGEDMLWVSLKAKEKTKTPDGEIDEWGCLWQTMEGSDSFGEPKTFPLEGKEDLSSFHMPNFLEEWRYEDIKKTIAENNNEKYVLGLLPCGLFQHMLHLFGFMDFMMNTGANPQLLEDLCDILLDSIIQVTKKMAALGVHGVITLDDSALQDRPMISMDAFRTIFKPRFQKFYDACHALGIDTFIHSCGYTLDIIEELIDAGVDVVNLDQQDNMDIRELSRRYRGRVCFYCPLDIQTTLQLNEEQLKERVHQMTDLFANEHGGFIAKTYPQPTAIGITNEYMQIVCSEFKKYGGTFYDR